MPPQSQPFKVCPRCQTPAELDVSVCVHCGRQYNTQFTQVVTQNPPTQKFTPPPASLNTQMLGVHQAVPLTAYGPKDRIEWNVSAFWHWLGLYLCAGFAVGSGWYFVRLASLLPWGKEYWLLLIVLAIFGASFCALRLRRLYVYFAAERRPWWLSAGLVCALILVPVVWREYQFQMVMIEMHRQEVAAQQQEIQNEQQLDIAREQSRRAEIEYEQERMRQRTEAENNRVSDRLNSTLGSPPGVPGNYGMGSQEPRTPIQGFYRGTSAPRSIPFPGKPPENTGGFGGGFSGNQNPGVGRGGGSFGGGMIGNGGSRSGF